MNRLFLKGVKHGLPIGLGYLSVAFTFGMKAVSDGLTPLQALLISMTNVTSAGQFAGLPLMIAQALLTDGFTTLLKLRQGSFLHTAVYAVVMTVLYFVSYSIQQRWVFASRKKQLPRGNEK